MQITRVLFAETGTYDDMYNRPYVTSVDLDALRGLQQATEGGTNLTTAAVAGMAGVIMRPQTAVQSGIGIVNGWGERKLRFMMEVEHAGFNSMVNREILTGYTNYPGYSSSGAIDPAMLLYVNNVITVRETQRYVNGQVMTQSTVVDASHVLSGTWTAESQNVVNPYYMRPEDVFGGIMLNNTLTGIADGRDLDVIDTRVTHMEGIKKSRRSNSNAANYLSNVFTQYMGAFATARTQDSNLNSVLGSAKKAVEEHTVEADQALQQLTSMTDFTHNRAVRWDELFQFNPYIDSVTTIAVNQGGVYLRPLPQRGQFETWQSMTYETVCAQIISNMIPGIMTDLLIMNLDFTATNDVMMSSGHEPNAVIVRSMNSFSSSIPKERQHQALMFRINTELMTSLTHHGQVSVSISVQSDILADTYITMSYNGGPEIQYCMPSFCDALFPPVLTTDRNQLTMMSRDINNLAENIGISHP